jgi:hypothetical protein
MAERRLAPFNVRRLDTDAGLVWVTWNRKFGRAHGPFDTQAEAIDFAYKTWPWWP